MLVKGAIGRFQYNFRETIFKTILVIGSSDISCKITSGDCHRTSLVTSQQYFRQWLGAAIQQTITSANVNPFLCHHMASLSHNDSIRLHNLQQSFLLGVLPGYERVNLIVWDDDSFCYNSSYKRDYNKCTSLARLWTQNTPHILPNEITTGRFLGTT